EERERDLRGQAEDQRDQAKALFDLVLDATGPQTETGQRALLEKAELAAEALLQTGPNDPKVRFRVCQIDIRLGDNYRRIGATEKAAAVLGRAADWLGSLADEYPERLEYRAEQAAAWQTQALAFQQAGRLVAAEEQYCRAVKLLRGLLARHTDDVLCLR